jgi:hypothetical protein
MSIQNSYFHQFDRSQGAGLEGKRPSSEEHCNMKPLIWPCGLPAGGGLWGGDLPKWGTWNCQWETVTLTDLAAPGTWSTEEYESVNEEQFTLMNLAAPWGRGLAQLQRTKISMRNSSLWPIWPPPGGGFGDGGSPNWRAGKCQWCTAKSVKINATLTDLQHPWGNLWKVGDLLKSSFSFYKLHFDQFPHPWVLRPDHQTRIVNSKSVRVDFTAKRRLRRALYLREREGVQSLTALPLSRAGVSLVEDTSWSWKSPLLFFGTARLRMRVWWSGVLSLVLGELVKIKNSL